ncbi:MAG TPA: ABC transporter substrate-binding protein [Streptosporangiaceae bacterium]|nr:ABC transporter substrate-binding protein [Streptosporangiaceae bacterium]
MKGSAASALAPGRRRLARRLRPVSIVLAGLAPLLVVTGCNPLSGLSSSGSTQVIKVGAVPGIDNANLYVAVHGGYFARAGVSVKIVRFTTVSKEIAALNDGTVNAIAADYGDMFYAEAAAANPIYRVLADGYDAAPGVSEILTMPDSTVKSPGDLAGQTIPVPNTDMVNAPAGVPNTLAVASANAVLQSDGVNLAGVTFKPMPQGKEIVGLSNGTYKAALLTGLDIYLAQQQGAVELIDACSGPTAQIPLDGFFTTGAWVSSSQNAKAARAFQQGIYAADAAAALPGPIQSALPAYAGFTPEEAHLVTTGTYPLSTIAANLQRTADLIEAQSMTKTEVNVAPMLVR